jgi:hypothetical protein
MVPYSHWYLWSLTRRMRTISHGPLNILDRESGSTSRGMSHGICCFVLLIFSNLDDEIGIRFSIYVWTVHSSCFQSISLHSPPAEEHDLSIPYTMYTPSYPTNHILFDFVQCRNHLQGQARLSVPSDSHPTCTT